MWKVPFFDLNYDEAEENAVLEVMKSKWLSAGNKVKEFEKEFEDFLGKDSYCLTVSNCTAALHMALLVHNIGKGDEVIIPALTFVADLNVVEMVGATAVLADCKSKDDWNIDINNIKEKVTDKTKAIIIVHFAGQSCDMDEIVAFAKSKNIILIEDAAHAVGSEYKGIKCGTFGDISCFSFFSNKNLSTGEGGMIVCKDKEIYNKLKLLRSHGMTSMTIDRYDGKIISYDVVMPGLNYRSDEIKAALGIVQLNKLQKSNCDRQKIVESYCKYLSEINNILIPWKKENPNVKSSYHIFPVLLDESIDRIKLINNLKEQSIQTSIHYPSFKKFSYYKDLFVNQDTNIADYISEHVLTLPLYPNMKDDDVLYVCNKLKEAIK